MKIGKTKGRILKDRIKQKGFTQAVFADACGISLSALKKYITDELPYSIALLEIFSEKLDCSTAYLLGESETTRSELHELKELTHLSDAALYRLKRTADHYAATKNASAEKMLVTISYVLGDELISLIQSLLYFCEDDYFNEDENAYQPVMIGDNFFLYPHQISGMLVMNITERLYRMRDNFLHIKDQILIDEECHE